MRALAPPLLAALLASAGLSWFYGSVLLHPGDHLFDAGSDGLKNYFTPLWTVRYDTGLWFTGMNHPFGEHVVFTDNQPALSAFLRFIRPADADPMRFTIGALNLAMLASVPTAAWFLCLILRHAGVRGGFAVLAAAGIALLAPQALRMPGHYALSYACFIPLVWWLALQFVGGSHRVAWGGTLFVAVCVFGMLHVYYVLLATAFVSVFAAAWWCRTHESRAALVLVTSALAGGLLLRAALLLTDPVTDRPAVPYGQWVYNSNLGNLLLPAYRPEFVRWWEDSMRLPRAYSLNGTSNSFIGWAGWVGLGVLGWRAVGRGRARWKRAVPATGHGGMICAAWAGSLTLLVALAYPVSPLLLLANVLTPEVRQFRALARLEWIAWYVLAVVTAVVAYSLSRAWRLRGWRVRSWALLASMAGLWGWNAAELHGWVSRLTVHRATGSNEAFGPRFEAPLRASGARPEDFQAVLGLPMFLTGSEKLLADARADRSLGPVLHAAYELHLPSASGALSRTSLSQTLLIAQLASDPLLPREIVAHYPSQKPLLLLVTSDTLTPTETAIVARAGPLFRDRDVRAYRLPLAKLEPEPGAVRTRWRALATQPPRGRTWTSDRSSPLVWHRDFEGGSGTGAFGGKGAASRESGPLEVFAGDMEAPPGGVDLEVSAWVRPSAGAEAMPGLEVLVENPRPGDRETHRNHPLFMTNTLRGWVLSQLTFSLPAGANRVRVALTGEEVVADELLIRPRSLDVFTFSADGRYRAVNNIPFELPPPTDEGVVSMDARYNEQTVAVMRRVLEPSSTGIDVGAYVGEQLAPMVDIAPQGRHYARTAPDASRSKPAASTTWSRGTLR